MLITVKEYSIYSEVEWWSVPSVVEICEEVQGLIEILIVPLGSALTSLYSHIFLPSPLHQHSCLDHGSQSHLLQGDELSHSAII